MIGDIQEAAQLSLQWLERRYPTIPPGHRFQRYREMIDGTIGAPVDIWLTHEYQEAYRSILSLFHVASFTPHSTILPDSMLKELASGAVGGSLRAPATPWNLEFELFAASLLRMAGLADVEHEEPDLRVPAGDRYLGVAVKRVTSTNPSRAVDRLSEAAEQIDRTGHEGFVILALEPPPSSDQAGGEAAFERLAERFRSYIDQRPTRLTFGFLLMEVGFLSEGPMDGDDPIILQGRCRLSLHLSKVGDERGQLMLDWLGVRGSTLVRSLEASTRFLRSRWENGA